MKRKAMKISVIVPFNRFVPFLADCFLSLKEQTLKDFEVVLATPELEEQEREEFETLLKEYEGVFPLQHISCGNTVSEARNAAIQAAKGEYLYFLDADDYIMENTLMEQLQALEADPKATFSYAYWNRSYFQYRVYQEVVDTKEQEERKDEIVGMEKKNARDWLLTTEEMAETYRYFLHPKYKEKDDYQEAVARIMLARSGGLKNISCLGILIPKHYIVEHSLAFSPEDYLYEDLAFVVRLLDLGAVGVASKESVYVKRKHNDPVHYPAIVQIKDDDRFAYYAKAYEHAKSVIKKDGVVRFYLDEVFLKYYARSYVKRIRRSENDAWRTTWFDKVHELSLDCRSDVVSCFKGRERRIIKAAKNHSIKAAKREADMMLAWKKAKSILNNSHTFPRYLYYNYFTKMPVLQKTILFETFFGKSYSDSPKYIYEYINEHYKGQFRCVWSVDNFGVQVPYHAKRVKRYSIAYMYYLARAKYQVFNVRQPLGYRKQEDCVFLECWHGTPLKRLVFDQEEVMGADPKYKSRFYKHMLDWDYLISPNEFSTEKFQTAFRIEKDRIETCGYPRNDILYTKNNEAEISKLKERLGIPKDKKVILYAPTWRDDDYVESGKYNFKLKLDLAEMRKRLSDEYVVVLRMHYYIASNMDISEFEGFAFDESSYNDISELYLISDILITDYSSVFFDYGNLKRPVLFFTYDLEKYRDMLRGFYLDIEKDVPGPLLYTSDEVIDAIEHIDEISEQYKERYEIFYDRFCSVDDGHASQRICEKVFGKPNA